VAKVSTFRTGPEEKKKQEKPGSKARAGDARPGRCYASVVADVHVLRGYWVYLEFFSWFF
jgi:hypothetical protein